MDISAFLKSLKDMKDVGGNSGSGDPMMNPGMDVNSAFQNNSLDGIYPSPLTGGQNTAPNAPPSNIGNPALMKMLGVPQTRPELLPQNPQGMSPLLSPTKSNTDQRPEVSPSIEPVPLKLKRVQPKATSKPLRDDEIVDVNSLKDKEVPATTDAVDTAKAVAIEAAQKAQYTGSSEDLAAAQQAKNDYLRNIMMMQAGSDIGRSMAGLKTTDNKLYKDLSPFGEAKVSDVIERQTFGKKADEAAIARAAESRAETTEERHAARAPVELAQMQKNLEKEGVDLEKAKMQLTDSKAQNDPNSDVSKAAYSLATQMSKAAGVNLSIPPGMSYSQMQQLYPSVTKFIDAKMSADVRKDMNAARNQDKEEKATQKQSDLQDKRFGDMGKALQSELASSRSALGTDVKAYNSIQNIKALLEGQDLNHIDSREMYEVARSLDRVLSQGGSTISGAEHLTPDTARSRIAKLMEFITNKRQGVNGASFLNRTLSTLEREGTTANKRIQASAVKSLGRFSDLKEKNPDRWNEMLQINNIPTDAMENAKNPTPKKAEAPHGGKYPPGSVVSVKGKNYVVGADGDTLTPK